MTENMDAPGTPLARIDCARDYSSEQFLCTGDDRVVAGEAGRYREAAGKPLSRFGYRFRIERVGQPHLALIHYPDDKRRFMCVMDGTCYDLSTGVTAGFAYPLSGGRRGIRQVFWPRWHDCPLVFMTWGHGEPAAVASVEIQELDSLPALPSAPVLGGGPRREFGIQYEGPCGTGASEGAMSKEEWVERVIAYARHTGQTLFTYPIAWYHGPQYPSREPADTFDMVVAPDRKQYSRWTTNPPDWITPMLKRFGAAGLGFVGSLTLLRLGSLMQRMNLDLAAVQAGADTVNNVLWCDQIQAGTMDWTAVYNARNYPALVTKGKNNSGYDDYTAGLFTQETGIAIPVDPRDPRRFSKRYEFLTFHCRPAWVAWRCRKVHQLLTSLRDEVVAVRADLRLIATLWSEPDIPQVLGNGKASHQVHARLSTLEFYREAGFDPALYGNEPNLEMDFQFEGGGRDPSPGNNAQAPLESFFMFRDHDFLEQYAHAVAELDACRITRGGLFLDKAHSTELRGFAAAYRCLPAATFAIVGTPTDPVAVRTLAPADEDRRYLYLVNREPYPVTVQVALSQAATLQELATGKSVPAQASWSVALGPYELRSFATAPSVQVMGFTVDVPAAIAAQYEQDAANALQAIANARREGHFLAGLDEIENQLRASRAERRFARLRHLLTGYHVRKCRESANSRR